MLKYKLSVFILGLPVLNNTIPDHCHLTFKVINGKVSRAGFDVGYLRVMEYIDEFNFCSIVPYSLKGKHVTKQDASYSSHSQTTSEFES